MATASSATADLQWSDSGKYGRGEMHLSADLEEGDVVAYRIGNWRVDGVLVGDDSVDPSIAYCQVETIQVVWTHNCEHGVLRGRRLWTRKSRDDDGSTTLLQAAAATEDDDALVELGPEQLVARLPVEWKDGADCCIPLVELDEDDWLLASEG